MVQDRRGAIQWGKTTKWRASNRETQAVVAKQKASHSVTSMRLPNTGAVTQPALSMQIRDLEKLLEELAERDHEAINNSYRSG
jgi:hypothetical protein